MLKKTLWILIILTLMVMVAKGNESLKDGEININEKTQIAENTLPSGETETQTLVTSEAQVVALSDAKGEPVFKIDKIDEELSQWMQNKSFKENDFIQIEDLRLLTVTYYGFDQGDHLGQLVVNKEVAEELITIFETLYASQYPIDKIKLVDYYDGNDDLSMADNNTSCFNYRVVSGSTNLSKHSFGLAIDINPVQNPYVTSKGIFPAEGKPYTDRSLNEKGMILEDDLCYKLFTEKGWIWGGHFKSVKDYQHFEKASE